MAKRVTTFNIEDELVIKAKERGINISSLINQTLTKILTTSNFSDHDKAIEFLENKEKEIQNAIETIKKRKQDLTAKEEREKQIILEKYSSIPEVNDLTHEFLKDRTGMIKLVDFLREKYPNLRASLFEIRDYFQLKEDIKC